MLKLFFMYMLLTAIIFPAWVISSDDKILEDVVVKCEDLKMEKRRVLFTFFVVLSALGFIFVPYKLLKDTMRKFERVE